MDEVLKDERFSHVFNDPRFRKIPKRVEKIAVDKRFKQMFNDRKFKEKYVMDKRGRPLNMTSSEDLKKLYNISSGSSSSEDEEEESDDLEKKAVEVDLNESSVKKKEKSPKKDCNYESTEESDAESEEKELLSESTDGEDGNKSAKLSAKKKVESDDSSDDSDSDEDIEDSSDSDTDTDTDSEDDQEFDHQWEELGKDAVEAKEVTKRLAVCNMDWDRIRAEDIFAAFDSFKPAGGFINSVKIFPSEFGKKRMEEEKLKGPPELVEKTLGPEEEDETETLKGSKYHIEKLRQYQINRLRYFYAVVECNSPETANSLHEQLNGMEYENSSIVFDIRFIPDDLTFDEMPHSEATQGPDLTVYKPKLFVTSALQQVKVNLTWDETDPKRRDVLRKAFTEPDDVGRDIQDYLASSSESDEEIIESTQHEEGDLSRKERMAKYRALLQSLEDKEKDEDNEYEMEITWEPGLKEKTEDVIKTKLEQNTLTPFEEKLKKMKDSRTKKKKEEKIISEESESISSLSDESDDDDDHQDHASQKKGNQFFKDKLTPEEKSKLAELSLMASDSTNIEDRNVRKTKGKGKKKLAKMDEDDEIPDINDPRFSAMYSSPLFSIDPTNLRFKSRKGMSTLIQAQQSKRKNVEEPLLPKNSSNFKRKKKF